MFIIIFKKCVKAKKLGIIEISLFYGETVKFYGETIKFYGETIKFYGETIKFYGETIKLSNLSLTCQ